MARIFAPDSAIPPAGAPNPAALPRKSAGGASVTLTAVGDMMLGITPELPPDPASYRISTIGGNVATNAGGLCCVKYGVTRDYVLGLTVVLADGAVVRLGRRTAKGATGYDLTALMVGSEGTLGIVTEVTLKLLPAQYRGCTVVASFDSVSAAADAFRR